ncbi:hypothetical protein DPMN_164114 [Dreissena polymorpha]|uniref:Uncharacterized protein n=1 Tax=Dreissena polymorpha TaxID=45954 RepID=A0A9D4EXX0_DREPO|nr:hypothetical protein DPMN_164114 [Dreissena polymorpha]
MNENQLLDDITCLASCFPAWAKPGGASASINVLSLGTLQREETENNQANNRI